MRIRCRLAARVEASVAHLGDASARTLVDGQEVVTFSDAVNSWVMWSIDDRSTAAVESSDLDVARLIEVARSVTSVLVSECQTLTAVEPLGAPSTTDDGASFAPRGTTGVVDLTITQLREMSEIWSAQVGRELTDPDIWGTRAADVCCSASGTQARPSESPPNTSHPGSR